MRGRLLGQLHDPLAEIGLDRHDPRVEKRVVETDLLGDHRLALDRQSHVAGGREFDHDPPGFRGVAGPVDDRAAGDRFPLEPLEMLVEPGEPRGLHRLRSPPQRL